MIELGRSSPVMVFIRSPVTPLRASSAIVRHQAAA